MRIRGFGHDADDYPFYTHRIQKESVIRFHLWLWGVCVLPEPGCACTVVPACSPWAARASSRRARSRSPRLPCRPPPPARAPVARVCLPACWATMGGRDNTRGATSHGLLPRGGPLWVHGEARLCGGVLGAQGSVSGGAARIAHRMARGPCVGLCAAGRRVIGSVFRFEGTDVERYIDCWITGILGAVTVRMSCMAQYTTSHRKTFPNHA